MIKNNKQLEVSKTRLQEFLSALNELYTHTEPAEPIVHKARIAAIKSSIATIEEEIETYESLKNGSISYIKGGDFDDLARILIQARLAKGITQAQLGEEIGIDQQQIQRYEANDYESTSLARIMDIVDALEVSLELKNITTGKSHFAANTANDEVQNKISRQRQILKIVA